MEKYQPTATLFLDTRTTKKNGKFPLKLTIYCKPQKKRYNINIDLSKEEWKKIFSERLRDDYLKTIKIKINAIIDKANKVLDLVLPFSFYAFEELYFENACDLNGLSLKSLFNKYAFRHEEKDNIGTAISYRTSFNSLNNFQKNISLNDITVKFLEEYEKYMIEAGKSSSTVGIYLRQLRAIYNDAISQNLISDKNYPFGKNLYNIPAGRNVKKSLTEDDIEKLINYIPINIDEQKALDFWIFSYLCSGINFCDIAKLRRGDIQNNFMYYIRSKTRNTKKSDIRQIKVPLHERAKKIIAKWQSNNAQSEYLFPVLNNQLTPKSTKYRIQGFIKQNNKLMKVIKERLEISQDCNTYSCRHSFATMLKRKNVGTEYISESLGHSSLQTTSAYLDSFEDETKIKYSNLLTAFKNAS